MTVEGFFANHAEPPRKHTDAFIETFFGLNKQSLINQRSYKRNRAKTVDYQQVTHQSFGNPSDDLIDCTKAIHVDDDGDEEPPAVSQVRDALVKLKADCVVKQRQRFIKHQPTSTKTTD